MRAPLIFLMLVALGFTSCKRKKMQIAEDTSTQTLATSENQSKPITLYYERTACFGTCPIFRFTVFNDNSCLYEGDNFVEMIGKFTGKADRDEVIKVVDMAERIGYINFKNEYDNPMIMDIPAIVTQVNTDGKKKSMIDRYQGPTTAHSLYEAFDELILSIKWKKTEQ